MRHGLLTLGIGFAVFLFSLTGYSQKSEKPRFCQNATTLFTNATFITLNPKQPLAKAVAVSKQRLVAVGDKETLMKQCRGKNTQVIDLKNAVVVPGFIDTHSRFILYGWLFEHALDLSTTNVFQHPDWREIKTTEAFLDALKNREANADGWLIVNGYDPLRMQGAGLSKSILDNLYNNVPVLVFYSSGNQILANQEAIKKIATLSHAKQISIDSNGIIRDKSFQLLLTDLINKEAAIHAIQIAAQQYAQQGYTTATEAMVNPAWVPLYEQLTMQSAFPVDIILTPNTLAEKKQMDLIYQDNPRLYAGAWLIQVDGAAQDREAFFTFPYLQSMAHPNTSWPENLKKTPRELDKMLATARKEKVAVALECNGDAAVDLTLNLINKTQLISSPTPLRAIIINAPYVRIDQIQRMQQLGVKVSWFAPHFYFWHSSLCNLLMKPHQNYPGLFLASAKEIMKNLSVQANAPSTPPIPLQIMRQITSGQAQNWLSKEEPCTQGASSEKITLPEALSAFTFDAALVYGLGSDKGSIESGKLADMTILSGNPLQANSLQDIKVLGTISRGILRLNSP
ncbi:amidohydrolase [Legionella cardiaca]|uniref:Amidohydrolase family protein n=1 Tax=Legionella cardiaca TaxID=1071983 RepID=A0ABY8ATR5_9GAMM|nr:amidohydrolase family protein [Legionella cardiaca]WED43171.1 amidohydrolase family protein [Legionella cardiaca]